MLDMLKPCVASDMNSGGEVGRTMMRRGSPWGHFSVEHGWTSQCCSRIEYVMVSSPSEEQGEGTRDYRAGKRYVG